MSYKEALMAFSNELKERTKSNEELHFFYQQVEKTLNFEPKAEPRVLSFYTGVLREEKEILKEGSDLENSINILYSTNEKVCNSVKCN
jgi:hypothetical protein